MVSRIRILCEGAVMLALAQILSYIAPWRLPDGGSVDAAMLPIVVFAVRWGWAPGILVGFVFGLMQYFFANGIAVSWVSILGDYAIAFAAVGAAGVFRRRRAGIIRGCLLAGALRFIVHWVVGATIWAEYMPETFFGMTMTGPWFYSAIYNGSYMVLDTALITALAAVLYKTLRKYMLAEDIPQKQ